MTPWKTQEIFNNRNRITLKSNIPENKYPETGIISKTLEIILQNRYWQTGIISKSLDIIPEKWFQPC